MGPGPPGFFRELPPPARLAEKSGGPRGPGGGVGGPCLDRPLVCHVIIPLAKLFREIKKFRQEFSYIYRKLVCMI